MSRAFVKEPEGEQAETDLPERPQSEHPNYISTVGLESLRHDYTSLQSQLALLKEQDKGLTAVSEIKSVESNLRYLKKRIESAIPVNISQQPNTDIRFGATVTLVEDDGTQYEITIVGKDETDIENNRLSWLSPLPRQLNGKVPGDIITWEKPEAEIELEIVSFHYIQPENSAS